MLETWNLVRKHRHIPSFRKYDFQYQGSLNFADTSICLQKISVFRQKQYLYSKQYCHSCVRDFLVLFLFFVRQKVTFNGKVSFTEYASLIRLPDGSKLVIKRKSDNGVTICRHDVTANFFQTLLSFSCHVQLLIQVSCHYHHQFWSYMQHKYVS